MDNTAARHVWARLVEDVDAEIRRALAAGVNGYGPGTAVPLPEPTA